MKTEDFVIDIRKKLLEVEKTYGCKILFAGVRGSRAYKLDDENSDCDTHFVYVYPADRYLNLTQPQEYITIGDDISGYELRKFIGLMRKSAFNLMETLHSPFPIMGNPDEMLDLANECINPRKLIKSLCGFVQNETNRFNRSLTEGTDNHDMVKHCLSTARMYLTAKVIFENRFEEYVYPPIIFTELVNTASDIGVFGGNPSLKTIILNLAECKRKHLYMDEKELTDLMDLLNSRVDELSILSNTIEDCLPQKDIEIKLNSFFRSKLGLRD